MRKMLKVEPFHSFWNQAGSDADLEHQRAPVYADVTKTRWLLSPPRMFAESLLVLSWVRKRLCGARHSRASRHAAVSGKLFRLLQDSKQSGKFLS